MMTGHHERPATTWKARRHLHLINRPDLRAGAGEQPHAFRTIRLPVGRRKTEAGKRRRSRGTAAAGQPPRPQSLERAVRRRHCRLLASRLKHVLKNSPAYAGFFFSNGSESNLTQGSYCSNSLSLNLSKFQTVAHQTDFLLARLVRLRLACV